MFSGVLLLSNNVSGLRGSALVAELKAKAKAALLTPTETVEEVRKKCIKYVIVLYV